MPYLFLLTMVTMPSETPIWQNSFRCGGKLEVEAANSSNLLSLGDGGRDVDRDKGLNLLKVLRKYLRTTRSLFCWEEVSFEYKGCN